MSDELKPCPFCNGEGVIYEYSTVEMCPCSMRPAQPAEAEGVELQRLAAEFDAAPDDTEWEPPHPIFQMARDLDRVTAALSAVTAERDAERRRADVAVADANDAERERDQLRAEVERLRPVAREFAGFFSSDEPRHWELHALADGAALSGQEAPE